MFWGCVSEGGEKGPGNRLFNHSHYLSTLRRVARSTYRNPSARHHVLQALAGAHERQAAGQQQVQHYAGRPHVTGLAVRPIRYDFRRHVMRGAHAS